MPIIDPAAGRRRRPPRVAAAGTDPLGAKNGGMASRIPELPRARFRVLFFALLAIGCAATGWWPAVGVATVCMTIGIVSTLVAHSRGRDLTLTFVTIDWLGLGLLATITGGSGSPLLYTLPVLVTCHLLPTPPSEWLHVVSPTLAGIAVLLIADPALGGDRPAGYARLAGLMVLGLLPPLLLHRHELAATRAGSPPRRRRAPRATTGRQPAGAGADPTTGFHSLPRVADLLGGMLRSAARDHEAVGLVCVRLVRWHDIRGFHGGLAAEAAAAAAARHIRRHTRPSDLVFRVCDDTFLLALRDRTTSQARTVGAELQGALAAHRLDRGGERLTAVFGVSSFPATRSLQELLQQAAHDVAAPEHLDAASSR